MRRLIAADVSAPLAFVNYHIAASRVRFDAYRAHYAAAVGGSVAGVDVDVQRAKAERAVIARRISERFDVRAAVRAHKAAVVFAKSFFIHNFTA